MNYKIVIASTNEGKVQEIKKTFESLKELNCEIKSLKDYDIPEPDEPYNTFMENAIHKAKYYAQYTNEITLADDSGVSIEALDGFPGVRTKDFVEECEGISNAFVKLQQLLHDKEDDTAYFSSAVVVYMPVQEKLITHEERDYGRITFPPQGDKGYGFDPVFIPNGYNQTFAQLGIDIKNKISHRAKALEGLIEKMQGFFKSAA